MSDSKLVKKEPIGAYGYPQGTVWERLRDAFRAGAADKVPKPETYVAPVIPEKAEDFMRGYLKQK